MADVPNIDYAPGPNYDWLQQIGLGVSAAGAITSIAGTYYNLKAQQNSLRMEALNAEFASSQANIRARAAERDAELIIRAGQQAAAWRGAQAAMDAASFRASTAARGVEMTGSAAEAERAIRLAAEVDKRTLRTNAEMRAAATREAAANERGGGLLSRASAANLRASASSINPVAGAIGTGLSAGGSLLTQYVNYSGRR